MTSGMDTKLNSAGGFEIFLWYLTHNSSYGRYFVYKTKIYQETLFEISLISVSLFLVLKQHPSSTFWLIHESLVSVVCSRNMDFLHVALYFKDKDFFFSCERFVKEIREYIMESSATSLLSKIFLPRILWFGFGCFCFLFLFVWFPLVGSHYLLCWLVVF